MKVKAVAVDIDGTLTDENRKLNLEAVSKLRKIEGMGVPVILATGNILCITEAAALFIGTSGFLIAENGGVIRNRNTDEVIYLGDIKKVEEAYKHLSRKLNVRKVSRSEMRKTEIAIYRDVDVADIRRELRDFDVEVLDTKFAIHIKDPAVSKGKALRKVAAMLGIDVKDILAVGDSENDRSMLACAGYSISVGEKSLGDVSDFITERRLGDGANQALEHAISLISKNL